MERLNVTAQRVKAANRQFYDAVADCYEEIDGRRSPTLEAWLCKNLSDIRQQVSGDCLLDIGTGSGLVTRCAAGLFASRVGIDLSPKILAAHRRAFNLGAAADLDSLPFANASFDVVTCFAVLHHLHTFEGLVTEVARVLRPGGIFYSDHDMDAAFYKRFWLLLRLYRGFHNTRSKYSRASQAITPELYHLTEWQENGVDSSNLIRLFERTGFAVKTRYHWYGLSPILDRLLGAKQYKHGLAPLLSIVAIGGKS